MTNTITGKDRNELFVFDKSFLNSFNVLISSFDKVMDELEKSCISFNCDYGICNHTYKLRYITPDNISAYVSNLAKVLDNGLVAPNINDVEMFTVASVKRFIEENHCVAFENTTMMYGRGFVNPKSHTLSDLLALCENDLQGSNIYSTTELEKRADVLKEDINKLNKLHFVANMKNIVNGLPKIINQMDSYVTESKMMSEIFKMFIEKFILFACSLNNITAMNMIAYCNPQTSYSFKPIKNDEKKYIEYHGESVDITDKSPVYVCFFNRTNHRSLLETAIRKVTHSDYSHVSLSFDPSLKTMYSYAGISEETDINNKQLMGLTIESINNKYDGDNICVYVLWLDNDVVLSMEDIIKEAINHKTKYDIGQCIKKIFNIDKLSRKTDITKSICSTFVQQMLSITAKRDIVNKNIPAPTDLLISFKHQTSHVFEIYNGTTNDYNVEKVLKLQDKITSKKKNMAFDEVITECCLLKTNELTVRNRLPFDCNFKNIVICDLTPKFIDTNAALDFIVKDVRSPICILLSKYLPNDKKLYDYYDDKYNMINLLFNTHMYDDRNVDLYRYNRMKEKYTNPYENMEFHTDLSWLNNITYGNNFSDCNYRRDAVGNNHTHPIKNTLDVIYRMFNPCGLNSNEDLSINIMRVYNTMKSIIGDSNLDYNCIKEILVVLGEILTRSILKLYHNNTIVIDVENPSTETTYTGRLYVEGFVLEADGANEEEYENTDTNPILNPKVTVNGNKPTNKMSFKQKISYIINKFKEWIIRQLSKFSYKFNEDHKREIEWIKNNKNLNARISEAIQKGTFSPTVTDMPVFNIPAQEILSNINVLNVVNKWLNSSDPIDAVAIKKELYPGGAIAGQIASMKTEAEEIKALSYYVLYKQITPRNTYTGKLKKEQWDGLIKDLTETGNLIENATRKVSDELRRACEMIQSKIRQNEVKKNTNDDDASKNEGEDRTEQLFNVVQSVSKTYYVTLLNTLRSKFYYINYKLYRDLVTAYNQQNTSQSDIPNNVQNNTSVSQQQNQNNQQQTQNNAGQSATQPNQNI